MSCLIGKVRSKEKYCRKCVKPYEIIEEFDIICYSCQFRPKSFYIYIYYPYKGKRDWRIYSRDGFPFRSYKEAHTLERGIRADFDKGIFSLANYLPLEIEEFKCKNQIPKWRAICT